MSKERNETGPTETGPTEDIFGAATHERPVPRISIEAFCQYPDTLAALQQAAADRRFAKAHIGIHQGGISEAVSFFGQGQAANLLIVETNGQRDEVLAQLEQLAKVCDESIKVVVLGRVNDVQLYRELIRRGVSEYLVGPLSALQLMETISGLYLNPQAPPIGRVVAFAGARGGAGASTIGHNVAWCVAEYLKINTVILDLDLPFGTAGLDFNEDTEQGMLDALMAPERLDDVLLDRLLIKCGKHLSLFAAPALLDRDYEIDPNAYESVIDQVRNSIPCVIVDLPHAWVPWSRQILTAADEIVIVATPDLASLRNAKNMLDVLKGRRVNDQPPKLVLNQTGVAKRPEIPTKEFAAALGLDPVVVLPFDPQVFGTASNNGQMVSEIQPGSPAAGAMRMLAGLVTGRTVSSQGKKGSLSLLPFRNRKVG